jgi:hypothetical protein
MKQRDAALAQLAGKEGQVCGMRATIKEMIDNCGCDEDRSSPCANCNRGEDALSSPSSCPHAKEAERWAEAVEALCREILGAIIDATTMVQVEKMSGNIVKEAHVKGELFSLRLLESWLDRHVPEKIAELRRRAGGEG